MAITITKDAGTDPGSGALRELKTQAARTMKIVTGLIDFDASYPTGGEDITDVFDEFEDMAGTSGANLLGIMFETKAGHVFEADYTNKKVLAFWGDYSESADGALVEVADTTDLSALTDVRYLAYGWA